MRCTTQTDDTHKRDEFLAFGGILYGEADSIGQAACLYGAFTPSALTRFRGSDDLGRVGRSKPGFKFQTEGRGVCYGQHTSPPKTPAIPFSQLGRGSQRPPPHRPNGGTHHLGQRRAGLPAGRGPVGGRGRGPLRNWRRAGPPCWPR